MTLCTYGPPEERQRRWILKFDDPDVGDMHFEYEPEAMRAFARYSGAWTCTLFVTAEFAEPDRRRVLTPASDVDPTAGADPDFNWGGNR